MNRRAFAIRATGKGASLTLATTPRAPARVVLRLPPGLAVEATCEGKTIEPLENGELPLPPGTLEVAIAFR